MKDSDFKRVPISDIDHPPEEGFTNVMSNRWWGVVDECVLLYRDHSWQCNSNKSIAERVCLHDKHPATEVRFIERVFVPHKCEQYY